MNRTSQTRSSQDRWALAFVEFSAPEPRRTSSGHLVTVDCSEHGRSVPEPRHLDTHHTDQCPDHLHCPWCFHGWPLEVCACVAAASVPMFAEVA